MESVDGSLAGSVGDVEPESVVVVSVEVVVVESVEPVVVPLVPAEDSERVLPPELEPAAEVDRVPICACDLAFAVDAGADAGSVGAVAAAAGAAGAGVAAPKSGGTGPMLLSTTGADAAAVEADFCLGVTGLRS